MESKNHFKDSVCLKTRTMFLVVFMSFIAINMMAQTWKVGDNKRFCTTAMGSAEMPPLRKAIP